MVWWRSHCLLTSTVLAIGLGGCQASPRPSLAGLEPDFLSLLSLPGGNQPTLVRGQKKQPDADGKSLLELGPDAPDSKGLYGARIRAVVNGEAILEEEVRAAVMQVPPGRTDAERAAIVKAKLDEIIERELLMQDAIARLSKRNGSRFFQELEKAATREFERQWLYRLMRANNQTDMESFKRFLADAGMPLEQIQRHWVRNFIAMEYLRTRIEPHMNRIGHLQIQEYYQAHPNEFRVDDSVVWQDIFIAAARHPTRDAARQFAESLVTRIRNGEDFVRLAREFDNGDSSLRENAEGIGHKRGEIKPVQAEAILFALKDNEVGPVIEIETGYHIVRLVKRTYAGTQAFDEKVQKQIREKLRNQVFQKEMRRMINDLKRNAIIEVVNENK